MLLLELLAPEHLLVCSHKVLQRNDVRHSMLDNSLFNHSTPQHKDHGRPLNSRVPSHMDHLRCTKAQMLSVVMKTAQSIHHNRAAHRRNPNRRGLLPSPSSLSSSRTRNSSSHHSLGFQSMP